MRLTLAVLLTAAFLSSAMIGAQSLARRTGQSGWVDTIWSFATGTAAIGLTFGAAPVTEPARLWLVVCLVGLWSLRLGLHIAARTHGAGDDPRYAALRAEWGVDADRRMARFLQAQALAALPLAGAWALAAHRPGAFADAADGLGLLVALTGLAGVWLADRQLADFRRARTGAVCDTGLWRFSRHPNYLFECVFWCGPALIAFAPLAYPAGLMAIAAPMLMYALLVHVSGIPPLERHMLASRGAAYAAYQARVPAFFPFSRPG